MTTALTDAELQAFGKRLSRDRPHMPQLVLDFSSEVIEQIDRWLKGDADDRARLAPFMLASLVRLGAARKGK